MGFFDKIKKKKSSEEKAIENMWRRVAPDGVFRLPASNEKKTLPIPDQRKPFKRFKITCECGFVQIYEMSLETIEHGYEVVCRNCSRKDRIDSNFVEALEKILESRKESLEPMVKNKDAKIVVNCRNCKQLLTDKIVEHNCRIICSKCGMMNVVEKTFEEVETVYPTTAVDDRGKVDHVTGTSQSYNPNAIKYPDDLPTNAFFAVCPNCGHSSEIMPEMFGMEIMCSKCRTVCKLERPKS
tara:strand:+ start:110 stop:829 length:720 start_codon:yes stop_codon:yes gene_type:complete